MAHHQAMSQHQAVATSSHQVVHQNRAATSNSVKSEEHCKDVSVSQIDVSVKEEGQRITEVAHNREKTTETRLPVISMTSGYVCLITRSSF